MFQLSPASYSGSTGNTNPGASPGYGEGRSGWPSPPVTGQHGPGSPGPPSTAATPASQPSPQPAQPPSHSPGPGLPPSPQQHQQQGGPNTQHQVGRKRKREDVKGCECASAVAQNLATKRTSLKKLEQP